MIANTLLIVCLISQPSSYRFTMLLEEGPASPVSIQLPRNSPTPRDGMRPEMSHLAAGRSAILACQRESTSDHGDRLWFIAPATREKKAYHFTLDWVKHDGQPRHVVCAVSEEAAGHFTFTSGKTRLLTYNYTMIKKKPHSPRYDRCNYVHPIYGPKSEILTDDFPADHYHHRGLFWSWPRLIVGGREYDPWALGDSRHFPRSLKLGTQGPVTASLTAESVWRSDDGEDLVREKTTLRVYKPLLKCRIFDLEIRLWAASAKATRVGGRLTSNKGYGGLNYRSVKAEHRPDTVITMDGKRLKEQWCNQTESRWSDFSALFKGSKQRSGLAILGHPKNPAWPERWCNRYYGLLGTASPGLTTLELKQDRPVHFRYRILVHEGSSTEGDCEGHSRRFAACQ